MTMENYNQDNESYLKYSTEQNGLDLSMLALDLSMKKNVHTSTLPEIMGDRKDPTTNLPRTSPIKRRHEQISHEERDRQASITDSSVMLSPYSESNSPKRMNTDSAAYYENSSQLKPTILTNTYDIVPGITMVTPQQPSLPMPPSETTKVSAAMASVPIMCAGTSQSFMTHNEVERNIPFLVSAESTDVRLTTPNSAKKASRPFKTYPKNFLPISSAYDDNSNENFVKFRETMLQNVKKANANTPNPRMRRVSKSPGLPTSTVEEKDAAYWERRRKNNEAAKKSRELRRMKEDELAIRAAFLDQENRRLKQDLHNLRVMYGNLYDAMIN